MERSEIEKLHELLDNALQNLFDEERIKAVGKIAMVVGYMEGYLRRTSSS